MEQFIELAFYAGIPGMVALVLYLLRYLSIDINIKINGKKKDKSD